MSAKTDLKRELDHYAAQRDTPRLVTVPDLRYLMVDGHGDPNTPAFAEATAALYPVAYGLKFASRKALGRDYVVPPLEGLWWAEDMASFTDARDKTRWDWTLMIVVPDWVPTAMVDDAVGGSGPVRAETLSEGLCVQALHVGPYDAEAALLERIHREFLPAHGLAPTGRHHEIYLGDPRRADPSKLRTILRQPVAQVQESS